MSRVQNAAMDLAHALARREQARRKASWEQTKTYWNDIVERKRVALRAACEAAGIPMREVGTQEPLPWSLDE